MSKVLVCVNDGLLKLRIKRILSEKNYSYQITDKPIKRDDLNNYDCIVIHTSYRLSNLYSFIENAVINKLATIIYITTNVSSNPFRKLKNHSNLIYVGEDKMDIELPFSIALLEKYNLQIKELSIENTKLNKKLEENTLINKCKRLLINNGMTEDEAHKHILKFAMDNHIDKMEACNRLLTTNSD
ncbi:MAG: ANTAR domain-containing protein [Tenericutes bacterium]|nr:ANTAR domain-containing protein [Mycoplasmatota bacterium]